MRGTARVAAAAWVALLALGPTSAVAQNECRPEGDCRFKKPNILLLLDYSSSMVGFAGNPAYFPPGQTEETRWDAALEAVAWIVRAQGGFFADNARIGLARFAHDPLVMTPGTTISTDTSFPLITDGFALDVPFDGTDGEYLECKGSALQAEVAVLHTTPPPFVENGLDLNRIMLTWTRGALQSAHELIEQTRARHASEPDEADRVHEVVLLTDGDWTCPDAIGQNCDEDPAPEAGILRADGIRTHVVAFGNAQMQPSLDEVALQGGTAASIDANSPQGIIDALDNVLDKIRNSVIVPECTRALPRVLVILDGSSSMIEGNAPGATKWDKARYALAGNPAAPNPGDPGYVEPIFSRTVDLGGRTVAIEDAVHLGLLVFAGADEQLELVRFGPCMRDNFAWALDPSTSCVDPGCTDPYAGFPITWTRRDSDADRDPPFVQRTQSFMPACNMTMGSNSCVGTIPNTFTGEGLARAREIIAAYKNDPAPYFVDDQTRFVNVLITDGRTSADSSDVRSELEAMVAAGIDTWVIGFGGDGDLDPAQLADYAMWGNTGMPIIVDPDAGDSPDALAGAIEGILVGIGLDACCVLDDCSAEPEPQPPGTVCGDGRIEGEETCDDGLDNASYGKCSALCDGPHLHCGDDRVDGPETCDDGNLESGDGCDELCQEEIDDAGTAPPSPPSTSGPPDDPSRTAARPQPPAPPFMPIDAGPRPTDAGLDAGGDAGGGSDDSGCGCRLVGQSRHAPPWLALALLTLVALARFRDTRRRSAGRRASS